MATSLIKKPDIDAVNLADDLTSDVTTINYKNVYRRSGIVEINITAKTTSDISGDGILFRLSNRIASSPIPKYFRDSLLTNYTYYLSGAYIKSVGTIPSGTRLIFSITFIAAN